MAKRSHAERYKAGAHTVTASMVGGKSEQLVVNFTADTLTAQVNLNVTEDNFIANNIGMTGLQATVTDGNGNPVEGIKVNFRGTSVTLSSTSVETDDQVFAEILVTSTEVGLKQFQPLWQINLLKSSRDY